METPRHHGSTVMTTGALFDQYGEPVGWLEDEAQILDYEGNYRAFICEERIYSYGTGKHVGFYDRGVLWSLDGGAVAFVARAREIPEPQPLLSRVPARPVPARRPTTPPIGEPNPRPPLRNWSEDALGSFFMRE